MTRIQLIFRLLILTVKYFPSGVVCCNGSRDVVEVRASSSGGTVSVSWDESGQY